MTKAEAFRTAVTNLRCSVSNDLGKWERKLIRLARTGKARVELRVEFGRRAFCYNLAIAVGTCAYWVFTAGTKKEARAFCRAIGWVMRDCCSSHTQAQVRCYRCTRWEAEKLARRLGREWQAYVVPEGHWFAPAAMLHYTDSTVVTITRLRLGAGERHELLYRTKIGSLYVPNTPLYLSKMIGAADEYTELEVLIKWCEGMRGHLDKRIADLSAQRAFTETRYNELTNKRAKPKEAGSNDKG